MDKGFYIATMGCQMNEYDSEFLAQVLMEYGYRPVNNPENAKIVLINTCTVREKADQKAMSLLGRMSRIKARRPGMVLGMIGCLAQKEGKHLFHRFPQLDMVAGPRELADIKTVLDGVILQKKKMIATRLDLPPVNRAEIHQIEENKVSAYVSIMQGCDNFCTYCIVPSVRGREISRPPEEIIEEAKSLVGQGVKEITLLGQNVNSYSREDHSSAACDFVSLLQRFTEVKGLIRLRFTTSHPKDLSDDLICCFRDLDILCPHIHLPFQAGSNEILRRMKRGYSRERYMELVYKLREVVPGIAITSDVMVGFPGESSQDFAETLDLIGKIRFDSLFSFKYSDREGTVAAHMNQKIDEEEKSRRLNHLQSLQRQITLQKNRALEGKKATVLVEGCSKKGGQMMGRTDTNKVVNFNSDNSDIGHIIKVYIKSGSVNSLWGEAIH